MQLSLKDLHRQYPTPLVLCAKTATQHTLGPGVLRGSQQVLARIFDGGRFRVFFHDDGVEIQSDRIPRWSFNGEPKQQGDVINIAAGAEVGILEIGGLRYEISATLH